MFRDTDAKKSTSAPTVIEASCKCYDSSLFVTMKSERNFWDLQKINGVHRPLCDRMDVLAQ